METTSRRLLAIFMTTTCLFSRSIAAEDQSDIGASGLLDTQLEQPLPNTWCDTHRAWLAKQPIPNTAGAPCPMYGLCDDPTVRDMNIPDANTPIKTIRVHFVILRNDDGSNAAGTIAEAADQIDQMNVDFTDYRFQFVHTAEFADATAYRQLTTEAEVTAMKQAYAENPQYQCNVYVADITNLPPGLEGRGTYPFDPDALTDQGGILLDDGSFGEDHQVLTHEMGHNLGLYHPHRGVSEFDAKYDFCFVDMDPCDCPCYEHASAFALDYTGDFCNDTPPTPINYTCMPPGGTDDCSATPWGPTQPENFMGYAGEGCWDQFTDQQAGRMHCWTEDQLESWFAAFPGSAVGWGHNGFGQSDSPTPNGDFVAVDSSGGHNLGLRADGTIAAWGNNASGESTEPVPNQDFVAFAAGEDHSLALSADGSIVTWGRNVEGQCTVPPPNSDFVGIAAGDHHSVGLKSNGTVVAWGSNAFGQTTDPPVGCIAVAAGDYHSLCLRPDGSIVGWGSNSDGQINVTMPNNQFISIAADGAHSLGLKSDGSVIAWGSNTHGESNLPPFPNSGFIAVAAGGQHSIALRSNGSIVAWGNNTSGQCSVPAPNIGFTSIAGGGSHTLAITNLDTDSDGVVDVADNCPDVGNPGQEDVDDDGTGDACEFSFGDINGDGTVDLDDILCMLTCFAGNYSCASGLANADIWPCGGDDAITLDDILKILGAFAGVDACP